MRIALFHVCAQLTVDRGLTTKALFRQAKQRSQQRDGNNQEIKGQT